MPPAPPASTYFRVKLSWQTEWLGGRGCQGQGQHYKECRDGGPFFRWSIVKDDELQSLLLTVLDRPLANMFAAAGGCTTRVSSSAPPANAAAPQHCSWRRLQPSTAGGGTQRHSRCLTPSRLLRHCHCLDLHSTPKPPVGLKPPQRAGRPLQRGPSWEALACGSSHASCAGSAAPVGRQ